MKSLHHARYKRQLIFGKDISVTDRKISVLDFNEIPEKYEAFLRRITCYLLNEHKIEESYKF